MQRWVEWCCAAALVVFAWRAGAEWLVAWYSGAEPEPTAAQKAWLLARIVACLGAAVALAWPPPAA